MPTVNDLIALMERIAPTSAAEAWDNVGLLVGDPAQAVQRVLLTIDYTRAVAEEARANRCDAVIAYHPPIFSPLKRLTAGSLIFDAIRDGVAIYSPHTALDVAPGGTNDMLADVLGLIDRRPLRLANAPTTHQKLVTFVPESAVDAVSDALFAAGAGRIGEYHSCSFRNPGVGTFFGEAGANPAVGQRGRLEKVAEIRLETVVPAARLRQVVEALYKSHPYEEPAFDVIPLAAPPASFGQGRIGAVAGATREGLIEKIKRDLNLPHVLVAGPTTGSATTAACCAGSCGDLLSDAIAQGADVYLTGEMKHHEALRAAAANVTVVCALHSNSERATLAKLKRRIEESQAGVEVRLSEVDRDPFAML